MMKKRRFALALIVLLGAFQVDAQEMTLETRGEPSLDNNFTYTGIIGLYRSHSNGRLGGLERPLGDNTGFTIWDPLTWVSANTEQNVQYDDGSIWQGKGVNWYARAGVGYQNDWFHALLAPDTSWAQNLSYSTIGNQTQNVWGSQLDVPQRFGDSPLYKIGFGESDVRVVWKGLTAGVSNETVVIGPGERNNLILSRNSGGFPHFDIGTLDGWDTTLGTFEARFLWGLPARSQFSVDSSAHPFILMDGGSLGWEPSFAPGFMVGINKYYVTTLSTLNMNYAFQYFTDSFMRVGDYDSKQMLSFSFDFALPHTGFRTYAEISRNDADTSWEAILEAPERAMNWLWGAEYAFPIDGGLGLCFSTEFSDLGLNIEDIYRSTGFVYAHTSVLSWTNDGKYMGAGIGSGSNSQYFGAKLKSKLWDAGFSIERVCVNNDYLYLALAPSNPKANTPNFTWVHQFYLDTELSGAYRFGWGELTAEAHAISWYDRNWARAGWTYSGEFAAGYRWAF